MARFEPFLNLLFAVFWTFVVTLWLAGFVKPYSALTWIGIGIALMGWLLLIVAKWPQIKKGDLLSFGVDGLPESNKRIYRLSYASLFLAVGFLAASHFTDFLNMAMATDPVYQVPLKLDDSQ